MSEIKKIPFCVYIQSSDLMEEIIEYSQEICENHYQYQPVFFQSLDQAVEFLSQQEQQFRIFVLEYKSNCDNLDIFETIRFIQNDPWLHGTPMLAITDSNSSDSTNRLIHSGVVDAIPREELYYKFLSLIQTISSHKEHFDKSQFIFRPTHHKKGKLILKNDLRIINKAIEILMELCLAAGFKNKDVYSKISICLNEMITNAIEHGNCQIGFSEKLNWVKKEGAIYNLVQERATLPENKDKRVTVYYSIHSQRAIFQITDQGNGFQTESLQTGQDLDDPLQLSGRGILITQSYVHEMKYNEKGNSVQLRFYNSLKKTRAALDILQFSSKTILNLKPGDVLYENQTEYLYYILSGKFGVFSNGINVEILTPDNIFIGENRLLYNSDKIETIIALSNSKVLPISKTGFIHMIQRYPYSGIFLAKLLSKRLTERTKNLVSV